MSISMAILCPSPWLLACLMILCTIIRFIRGKVSFADQSERENPPKGSTVVTMLYGSKSLRDAYSTIVKLYEHFVGPIHFRVMAQLMGYQGIAMILEQMLNITDGLVRERVCGCGRTAYICTCP